MAINTKRGRNLTFPKSFEDLVRLLPPMAIKDDIQHRNTVEIIDRLMRLDQLSPGQANYLETLVELWSKSTRREATRLMRPRPPRSDRSGSLWSNLNRAASDLARLLGVHPAMESKIFNGERRLTWEHAKKLAARFKVTPALFMD